MMLLWARFAHRYMNTQNIFHVALYHHLLCKEDVDDVIQRLNLNEKKFKKYLERLSPHTLYNVAMHYIISCQASVNDVIEQMQLPLKEFRADLKKNGVFKLLAKPIILFDLNGVLVFRKYGTQECVEFRPGITEIKKLKMKYRVGVYTSVTKYNAMQIINWIENICGIVFDKHLIFTRQHTFPFTPEELELHNFNQWKMKKSLNHILAPEYAEKAMIIDDEFVRVVERHRVIPIESWKGDMNDTHLPAIVNELLYENPIH
jgi:NLI interacting factor-like phosphatase